MPWRRRARSAAAALVLAASAHAAAPKPGAPAPNFTVTTYDGRTIRLADLKGQVVILNFWATWCGYCRVELPTLDAALRRHQKDGLRVLAVATQERLTSDEVKPYTAALAIPFVHRMRGPYRGMDGLPTNYVIGRSGRIAYADVGAFDAESLEGLVAPLLREPAP